MTTAQTAFDIGFEKKLKKMMPFLVKTASGDEDLIQEGAIGIWQSMIENPDASDRYYANKAKWGILNNVNGVGKSIDIPKRYKRKYPITIVHYVSFRRACVNEKKFSGSGIVVRMYRHYSGSNRSGADRRLLGYKRSTRRKACRHPPGAEVKTEVKTDRSSRVKSFLAISPTAWRFSTTR